MIYTKHIIDALNARNTPISFEELHEKLITRELATKTISQPIPFPAIVLVAQYRPFTNI